MSTSLRASKSFYDWVKETDQFGEQIIFTINRNSSYRSFFGVLFSFILMLTGIAMFFFMGQSFFFKINPSVTASVTKSLLPPMIDTSNNNKMFVAFRYRDANFADFVADGTIYYMLVATNTPNKLVRGANKPAVQCNQVAGLDFKYLESNGLLDPNVYCVLLNSETFGGTSADFNYTSFSVILSFCSSTYSFCDRTKILSLLDVAQISTYVDFFYPEMFFDPNNFTNPIVMKHTKVTDVYLGKSSIYREAYFKQSFLLDDQGAIFENAIPSQYISVGDQFSRSIYKSDANDNTMARYYFYMGPVIETYKRKYQKLQDVIAVVGGFLRIVQIVLKMFLGNFVKYLRNIEIMNAILNWTDDEESCLPKTMNDKMSNDSKVKKALRLVGNSLDHYRPFNTEIDNKEISLSPTNIDRSKTNKHQESFLLDVSDQTYHKIKNQVTKNKVYSKVEKSTHKKSEREFNKDELDIYKLKNEIYTTHPKNLKKQKFALTFSELIKKMCCRRFLNRNQQIKVRIYDFAERYIKERLDVFGYLDLINEVNKIKSIFFNNQQIISFSHVENPTIPVNLKNLSPENIDNLKYLLPSRSDNVNENDVKNLSDYYAKRIYDQTLTFADKVLLMSLTEDILREVLHKLFEVKEKMRMNKNINFGDVDNHNDEVLNIG
jgi:hypothetical protein